MVGNQAIIKQKYTEPCHYWNYIHPEKLTALQTGREGTSINSHHERVWQGNSFPPHVLSLLSLSACILVLFRSTYSQIIFHFYLYDG